MPGNYDRLNKMCSAAGALRLGDEMQYARSSGRVGGAGTMLFADSVNGNDNNDGLSWGEAKATIQEVVDLAVDYSWIFLTGRFDENVITPAWASGAGAENVKIIGMDGPGGFYPNVPEWRSSNNTTGIPLIVRSVGWTVEGIKFRVPQDNVAVKLRYRVDDNDSYDAVHANLAACCQIVGCWFYGGGTGKTAINLVGAPYCTTISGNYFSLIHQGDDSGKCITCTESSMASPFRTEISYNRFNEVDGAIDFNAKGANSSLVIGNIIQGASHAGYSAGKKCDMGSGGNDNTVVGNYFGGLYTIAAGYQAGSGDNWIGNYVFDVSEATVENLSGLSSVIPT